MWKSRACCSGYVKKPLLAFFKTNWIQNFKSQAKHTSNTFSSTFETTLLTYSTTTETNKPSKISYKVILQWKQQKWLQSPSQQKQKNSLRGLKNIHNSPSTLPKHPVWCMERFISHKACQTRPGTQPKSTLTRWKVRFCGYHPYVLVGGCEVGYEGHFFMC